MLDSDKIDEWRKIICDRFTPEELLELLGVSTEQVFDAFFDECLEIDPENLK